jgi:hypothetical protein
VEVRPKIDHNINLAGLLITDANLANKKVERAKEGVLKGYLVFRKKLPNGSFVAIFNGAEFPTPDAVDFLLYLLWLLEKNEWQLEIEIESLNKLAQEVFGVKRISSIYKAIIERILAIWKGHGFFFDGSFIWHGQKITKMFGVIDSWELIHRGRGKPTKLRIRFNPDFVDICKNTDWYRRPCWIEVRKLRKEVAKTLYLLSLEYKPSEKSKEWKIYIDSDIKSWYRNALNSLANPKHLRPSLVLKRLKGAIEEINQKTNLRMELQQTEGGNYYINVKEVAPLRAEVIRVPFDSLTEEDKALLLRYVEVMAEKKKIENVYGFVRSMTSRQLKIWLRKAEKYFSGSGEREKNKEGMKFVERPELLEFLRDWAREEFAERSAVLKAFFGKDKVLQAFESDKKIVFKCVDRIVSEFLSKNVSTRLEEIFSKEVVFTFEKEIAF